MGVKKNKNKGFTLVEVLVAIVILGILSSIAIVGVQSVMNSSRTKYYKSLREMIISAAKDYYSDNKQKLPVDIDDDDTVTLQELEDGKYIDKVEDADGKKCYGESSIVTVTKESAKEYSYTLVLECPDPKMPDFENESNSNNRNPKITFKLVDEKIVGSKKETKRTKKSIKMCIAGRTDYTYELFFMKRKESKFKEIKTKKGNLKSEDPCVTIPLDSGSGSYYVRGRSGDTIADSRDSIDIVKLDAFEPSCEGLKYTVNHVAKQWFKGSLDVSVSIKSGNDDKYFIESYDIAYGSDKVKGLTGSNKKSFMKDGAALREELIITIHNDAGDDNTCNLGTYWMDNKAPNCTDIKPNTTWTNDPNAKVTTGCYDNDKEGGVSGVKESGCRQDVYEDSTEDEFADFNKTSDSDTIYIEDKVGNVAVNDNSCRFLKMIDRTAPRCSEVSKRAVWTKTNTAFARCEDDIKKGVTPSGCTEDTKYQEEADPEGATTTFTIKDKAGNTTPCLAEKKRDHTPPICVSVSGHHKWSKTGRATATCSDPLSGCDCSRALFPGCQNNVFKGSEIDGELEDVKIFDSAGNENTCRNAHKDRDNVAPTCVNNSFSSSQQTTTDTCQSQWTATYTNPDPQAGDKSTVTQQHGITRSFTGSCWIRSTVSCKDDLSGCLSSSFTAESSKRYGNGGGLCYSQGCCNGVRSADCSNVNPPTIKIEDEAGNTAYCDGTYHAPAPRDEPVEDDASASASCNLVSWRPGGSSNVSWLQLSSVSVGVQWNTSIGITVDYEGSGTFSGSEGNKTISFGNGVFRDNWLVVRDKKGGVERCWVGDFFIDNVPPVWTGGVNYRIVGNSGAIKCVDSVMSNKQSLTGSKVGLAAWFSNVSYTDVVSGVEKVV